MTSDKVYPSSKAAIADIPDGATILLGGFGGAGIPENLLVAMADHPAHDLTVVTNHAGFGERGLAVLLRQRKVRKIICSYAFHRSAFVFRELFLEGKIELEQLPQGTMAERIRAAGAGIAAFYTPTGVGTQAAEGKETRTINGRETVLEHPLPGDVAIIKAHRADRRETSPTGVRRRTSTPSWRRRLRSPSSRWRKSWTPASSRQRACIHLRYTCKES